MKLLAIDTSGASCSAALLCDGALSQRLQPAARRHGELILKLMDALMGEAGLALGDLDALAFGRGPGSFTGLRIAAAVVQGVAFGADLPVVGISTLAALAQGARRTHGAERALCAFDARMGELYWGAYETDETGLMRPRCDDLVGPPRALWMPPSGDWLGLGDGWSTYSVELARLVGASLDRVVADRVCEALDIAVLAADACARGMARPPEEAVPVYLRNKVTAAGRD